MKKLFHGFGCMTLVVIGLLTIILTASTVKEPKKYKATIVITYDSIDLSKLAEIEKYLNDEFDDANDIDVRLGDVETNSYYWHGYQLINIPCNIDSTAIDYQYQPHLNMEFGDE